MDRLEQIQDIKDNIAAVRVISFDVFDTLITRIVDKPEVVFSLLESKCKIKGFARLREEMQNKASVKAETIENKPHANLNEIYEYIAAHAGIDADWEEIEQDEIRIEKDVLRANQEMLEIYQYARSLNKKVIVTSDMYLDTATIKDLLKNCGYPEFDAYYISADVNCTKYYGTIFPYIESQEKVSGSDILHIGDNKVSDYDYAKKAGWNAYHYCPKSLPNENKLGITDGISTGLSRYLLDSNKGFWYNLGIYVGGPLYSGIMQWMHSILDNRNWDKIYFLARDGYNLYHLYRENGRDDVEYLYVSRRAMLLAGITRLDEKTLQDIPPYTFGQSVREILEYLRMNDVCNKHLSEAGIPSLDYVITTPDDWRKMQTLYKLNEAAFLDRCAEERENCRKYFEQIGFLTSNSIVFDCGWNGSSQYFLNKVLDTLPYSGKNHFVYIGIRNTEKSRRQLKDMDYNTYLFDYDRNQSMQNTVMEAVVLFELFFGAPEESVWYYGPQGPVLESLGNDESYKTKLLEGIEQYTQERNRLTEKYPVKVTDEMAVSNVIRLVQYPSQEEAHVIGDLKNVDGIAKVQGKEKYIAKLDWRTYQENPDIEIYWPQGLFVRDDIDNELKKKVARDHSIPYTEKVDKSAEQKVKESNVSNKKIGLRTRLVRRLSPDPLIAWENERLSDSFQRYLLHEKIERSEELEYNPVFSVVIPVYNVPDNMLRECIDSVLKQNYASYELILVDDCSTMKSVRTILKSYENHQHVKVIYRKENGHISRCTNTGLEAATGEFIMFMDCDDTIREDALYCFAKKLNENPQLDFIYSDEDKLTEDGKQRRNPHFKPDWSPDTFMSLMYTNHLAAYRRSLVMKTGGLNPEYDGAQDYDFTLRFMELSSNDRVGHIPEILYHWRERKGSIAVEMKAKPYAVEAMKRLKLDSLRRRDIAGRVEYVNDMHQFQVIYGMPDDAKISIIIPSKDNFEVLRRCLQSIKRYTKSAKYEIILVDNGSSERTRERLKDLFDKIPVKYIYRPQTFNFSRMCNIGVKEASGNFLLFLNDDIEITREGWIESLAGHASLPYAGAVGAKLLYPDSDLIQHIGIINHVEGPGHALIGQSDRNIYYFGRNRMNYNWSAVTGACLMIERKKYDKVGGFDESLPIAYNDTDLCFKLIENGYYNVVRNDVILYHHESVSRGSDSTDPVKLNRLQGEKNRLYKKHPDFRLRDPFNNTHLRQLYGDFGLNEIESRYPEQTPEVIDRKSILKIEVTGDAIIAQVDHVYIEYDQLVIDGWFQTRSYWRDNYKNPFVIISADGGPVYKIATDKAVRKDVADDNYTAFRCVVNLKYFDYESRMYKIGLLIEGVLSRPAFKWSDKSFGNIVRPRRSIPEKISKSDLGIVTQDKIHWGFDNITRNHEIVISGWAYEENTKFNKCTYREVILKDCKENYYKVSVHQTDRFDIVWQHMDLKGLLECGFYTHIGKYFLDVPEKYEVGILLENYKEKKRYTTFTGRYIDLMGERKIKELKKV